VRDHDTYDYAVIRVVPRVEREEFRMWVWSCRARRADFWKRASNSIRRG
jgi:hypothetical protein